MLYFLIIAALIVLLGTALLSGFAGTGIVVSFVFTAAAAAIAIYLFRLRPGRSSHH